MIGPGLLGWLLVAGTAFVVPPGREQVVLDWLAPVATDGFAGLAQGDVQIEGSEIRVLLRAAAGREESSSTACPRPPWLTGPGVIVLGRGPLATTLGDPVDGQRGVVTSAWLTVGYVACGVDGAALSAAAKDLAATLARADPDGIWVSPGPSRTDRGRWREPPTWLHRSGQWLLLAGIAVLLASMVLARRRPRTISAALALDIVLVAGGLWGAWRVPEVALLWLFLPLILFAALARVRRSDTATVVPAIGTALAALAVRAHAEHLPANWYVDYLAPQGAQPAFAHDPGGLAGTTQLIARILGAGSAAASMPFVLSVICAAMGVGVLVDALGRLARRSPGDWPPHIALLWGVMLAIDPTLVFLGASDAPHNVAFFAFSLGAWWVVELQRERGGPAGLFAAGICAALVAATRAELAIAPLCWLLLCGSAPVHRQCARAVLLGLAAVAPIVATRLFPMGIQGGDRFDDVVMGLWSQSPFAAEVFVPSGVTLALLGLFVVLALRRRRWLGLCVAYGLLAAPKLLGGFAGARIGGIDAVQRYNVILLPVLLLVLACAIAWLLACACDLLVCLRPLSRFRRAVAPIALGAMIIALVGAAVAAGPRTALPAFRVEYQFWQRHLAAIPAYSTILVPWLETLSDGRDLDIQLAAPHALLSLQRPDLHWRVLAEREGAHGGTGDVFYYRGATCSCDPQAGISTGRDTPRDRALVGQHVEWCDRLDTAVTDWLARESLPVARGTWSMRDNVAELGLGRLASP